MPWSEDDVSPGDSECDPFTPDVGLESERVNRSSSEAASGLVCLSVHSIMIKIEIKEKITTNAGYIVEFEIPTTQRRSTYPAF